MLRHLELIDDEASQYDVKLVKIDDPLMAKKYGHRDPPGLGYFRKGNYVKYDGRIIIQICEYFNNINQFWFAMSNPQFLINFQATSLMMKKCWTGSLIQMLWKSATK